MRLMTATLATLSVLSFTGCREALNPVSPLSPTESPDYAVYDAVLLGLFDNTTTAGEPTRYVLGDSTTTAGDIIDPSESNYLRRAFGPQLAPFVDAILSDYSARSSVSVPLDLSAFHVAPRIELLRQQRPNPSAKPVARNPGEFWSDFYARYPHSKGSISFSRPGYDTTRTHALLSYGHACGGLCGDWGFVLLERQGDRWVVLRRVVTAVS